MARDIIPLWKVDIMPNVNELRRDIAALGQQAEALLADNRKSMTIKQAELSRIKSDLQSKAFDLSRAESAGRPPGDVAFWGGMDSERQELGGDTSQPGSLGAPPLNFSANDVKALFEAVGDRKSLSLRAEGKAAVNSTDAPMAAIPAYDRTPFPFLRDRVRVLDAIPSVLTESPFVNYFKLTTGAVNAATVAEGATKPTSTPVWTSTQVTIKKIAHVASMTDEVRNDFPLFTEFLGQEMLAGLIDVENDQLLNGTGLTTNLTGLNATSGILTRARGADSQLDALAKAMTDLRVGSTFLEPDVVIMHPTDFQTIRLQKASGSGEYLASDPLSPQSNNVWGIKTLVTTKQPVGTALVCNLASAAKAYIRESPRVETSMGGAAEFAANVSLIRAEERLALTVVRPTGIVHVTGL
jgi:HK97 family phage major capsid protein